MKLQNFNIILAGVGGQGLISASQIIAAAAIAKRYRVLAFEDHGLARRGGSVVTFLRFGTELYTPSILEGSGNLMVAFEPLEALRYVKFMNRNGVLVLNTYKIIPIESCSSGVGNRTYPDVKKLLAIFTKQFKQIIALNATSLAEELGNPIVMNSILLGSVAASKVLPIPKKTFKEELRMHLPPKLIGINSKAFEMGYKRAKATK